MLTPSATMADDTSKNYAFCILPLQIIKIEWLYYFTRNKLPEIFRHWKKRASGLGYGGDRGHAEGLVVSEDELPGGEGEGTRGERVCGNNGRRRTHFTAGGTSFLGAGRTKDLARSVTVE